MLLPFRDAKIISRWRCHRFCPILLKLHNLVIIVICHHRKKVRLHWMKSGQLLHPTVQCTVYSVYIILCCGCGLYLDRSRLLMSRLHRKYNSISLISRYSCESSILRHHLRPSAIYSHISTCKMFFCVVRHCKL